MNIKELDKEYVLGTYSRLDLAIVSGKGSYLYSDDGKKYLDFGSGIAVNTFGASDKIFCRAIKSQLSKIQHTSNYYYTAPSALLAKEMCERTGMKKVFFCNSGAEANECAIKAARKYGTSKDPEKNVIITLKNSFHGRTVTTLSATGQDVFHKDFTPFTEGFVYCEANNSEELLSLMNDKVCAVMVEIVQGEGGVNTLSEEFLKTVSEVSEKYDALIIVDEVQTGNGRTGTLYAYEQFSLSPHIVSTAKGLGGGLPIGAIMFSEKLKDILPSGSHGSTFGGNPVCAAGALSVLKRLDESFLKNVSEKGEFLKEELLKIKGVKSVSGLGLMIGIETEKSAKEILLKCMDRGLLVLTAKDKVRLLPPLNIKMKELKKGLEILKGVIEE